jgi:hypothetical protein
MSIDSRLRNVQKSLKGRAVALLWLKTSQAKGGYLEYWKRCEFHSWASENEEAALLYYLVVEVNGAVITAAHNWRALASWAGLLGISMIDTSPASKADRFEIVRDFSERWRQKLCAFLADVVAVEQAVDLISQGYFDGHDVLFADTKEQLTSSYERAQLLVAGYNCFAEDNRKEPIDLDGDNGCPERTVEQRLNEWVMFSKSKALAACGRTLEARDEVLRWLNVEEPVAE